MASGQRIDIPELDSIFSVQVEAIASALHPVFYGAALASAIAFILTFFLGENIGHNLASAKIRGVVEHRECLKEAEIE